MNHINTEHKDDSVNNRNTSLNSGNPSSVTYGGSTDQIFNQSKMESPQHFSTVSANDEESVDTAYSDSKADVDGGYGWFVCLGALCALFTSIGVVFSWSHEENFHKMMFNDNPNALVQLNFVGTSALFCLQVLSPIVRIAISRFGVRPVVILDTVLIVLSMELASLATHIWHFYLTQGALFGAGAAMMYTTALSIPPQWFTKRRGLVLGIVASSSDLILLGYFVPLFLLPENTAYLGLSDTQGLSCVIVCCAMGFIGCIITGAVADMIGMLNSLIMFSLTTATACLLIWPFAFTFRTLMAFSVVFGIGSGSYFALMSSVTAEILGMERLQTGLSVLIFTNALSMFGPAIATAIDASAHASSFLTFKLFTGVCYLAGVLLLMALKLCINTSLLTKV